MHRIQTGLLFACLLISVGFAAPAHANTELKALSFSAKAGYTRFVFDLSAPVKRKVFTMGGKNKRVVIDLMNTGLSGKISQPPKFHPVFRRIRSSPRDKTNFRVVIDLKKSVRPEDFLLKPDKKNGHRLILDLYSLKDKGKSSKNAGKPELATAPTLKGSVGKPVESRKTKRPVTPVSVAKIDPTGSASSLPKPRKPEIVVHRASQPREIVIAIDAGHGGNDPGARGKHGTKEKDVVLSVAKKLKSLIRKEAGMRPVMIRDGDYYVGLRQRIKKARAAKADLLISIHADAFRIPKIRGSSVYTLSGSGEISEAARWLAAHENKADLVGGVSLDDKEDELAELLLELSQNATREASTKIAGRVLKNLKRMGPVHGLKVQEAEFVVLKAPDIPSILVETAFISNPSEEKKLRSSSYQSHLARAIFQGIKGYFANYTRPGVQVASRRHIISPGETLSEIAQKYRVSMDRLQTLNTLPDKQVKAGQILEIPEDS